MEMEDRFADWLYVEDHCEAIWQVLQHGRIGESYNVGGNNQPANLEIVDIICDIFDELKPKSPYRPHAGLKKFVSDRPGHDRRYAMNINKIGQELGWQPRHPLKEGLLKTGLLVSGARRLDPGHPQAKRLPVVAG